VVRRRLMESGVRLRPRFGLDRFNASK
jgi:hypothetical protein